MARQWSWQIQALKYAPGFGQSFLESGSLTLVWFPGLVAGAGLSWPTQLCPSEALSQAPSCPCAFTGPG